MLAVSSFSFVGIGMMTAVLPLVSPEKGTQLGFIAQGLLLVVSGVYYPVSVLPQWMQWISVVSPATYTLEGARRAMLDGAGVSAVWGDIWPLILIGVIAMPARPVRVLAGRALCQAARPPQAVGLTAFIYPSRVRMSAGSSIVCSAFVGTIAVPTAKNSITCEPQPWLRSLQLDADDALGLDRLGLGLHALHRQLARVVERLGEVRQLDVLADLPEPPAASRGGRRGRRRCPCTMPDRAVAGCAAASRSPGRRGRS